MKKGQFILIFLLFCATASAQDTIFLKTGERIPAVIVSKNETEIRYKKPGQPEPAAVYSVFLSDISSVHYSDGKLDDYTIIPVAEDKPKSALELAGNYGVNKIIIGGNAGYFMRADDNFDEFWEERPNNPPLGRNSVCYMIEMKFSALTGPSKRHWAVSGGQLLLVPDVSALGNGGLDEINIHTSSMNIFLGYGYAFNNKKNLIVAIEPGIDLVTASGFIRLNDIKTEFNSTMKTGWHISTGFDWLFSKIFHASVRANYRFLKSIPEKHWNTSSPTWYSSYYINGEPLILKSNGFYITAGLSVAMYFKYGNMRPQ